MDVDLETRHSCVVTALLNITNKQLCAEMLIRECESRISTYHYEGYCSLTTELSFLYEQLLILDSTNFHAKNSLLVLEILKDYVRINNVDVERSVPASACSNIPLDIYKASEAAHLGLRSKRLPYHSLRASPLPLLMLEISKRSLHKLLPLAHVLGLSEDEFHVAFIRQVADNNKQDLLRFCDFRGYITKIRGFDVAVQICIICINGSCICRRHLSEW